MVLAAESAHPYPQAVVDVKTLCFPDSVAYVELEFDPRCAFVQVPHTTCSACTTTYAL